MSGDSVETVAAPVFHVEHPQASEAPAWAADYVGIPYLVDGRTREGVDCWGLLMLVWRERLAPATGLPELPDWNGPSWSREAAGAVGAASPGFADRFERIAPGAARLGDGVLLRLRGQPTHCGLMLTRWHFLHALDATGTVIEDVRRMLWRGRIVGMFRWQGAA